MNGSAGPEAEVSTPARSLGRATRVVVVLVLSALAGALVYFFFGRPPAIREYRAVDRLPHMSPDYTDTVIPANIAPLNFSLREPGRRYLVRISGEEGDPIVVFGRRPGIVIPPGRWAKLLDASRGRRITFDVYVKKDDGAWHRFKPVVNTVAPEDIDEYLVYREMPLYNLIWTDMGIYQRNLRNYDETVVLHNGSFDRGCCNCHTFLNKLPDSMLMNVRGGPGGRAKGGMVIARNGSVKRVVNTSTEFNPIPAIYLAWHPSGKAVSFSTNKVLQCFHTVGDQRDVVDRFSDLALYLIDSNRVTTTAEIARPDRLETYTTWSPDGRYMYFCSAPKLPVERYKEAHYELMRIAYDLDNDTWGEAETVLSAEQAGRSITLPRFSPDGKWLLFCMSDYGNFPAFTSTSDLCMMDMETGKYRPLEINSDKSESYHSWSSNSRWFVFSSKRRDGLFARPYLSYVDASGRAHKPIILPQRDPAFYDSHIRIYNVPELIRKPVSVTHRELVRALHAPEKQMKAELDPAVDPEKLTEPAARDLKYEPTPGG